MTAYYNEINKHAAQWLRNLIEAGHIAPGYVDERSIEDVFPSDLRGFTQCHFFAGVAVWSHALRSAGWSDDREIWTGSCPCQPFSAAGQGAGFADERHLWPAFFHLIQECKPALVFGEQVASKDANPWIDLVQTDLEAMGYGVGAIAFPAASIGAPHIRDRLYWVADANFSGRQPQPDAERARVQCEIATTRPAREQLSDDSAGISGGLADTRQHHRGSQTTASNHGQQEADRPSDRSVGRGVLAGRVGYADSKPAWGDAGSAHAAQAEHGANGGNGDRLGDAGCAFPARPGPTNGYWRNADWLHCRDGKWRPVEPGTFPLAHGAASRVVRLRAYGNAINAKAAQAFIECVMESTNG